MGAAHLFIQWLSDAFSRGVKRPELEANHSPHSSAEVKNVSWYTLTPPHFVFIKHKDKLTFIFLLIYLLAFLLVLLLC
jgi:hypothetical protein